MSPAGVDADRVASNPSLIGLHTAAGPRMRGPATA